MDRRNNRREEKRATRLDHQHLLRVARDQVPSLVVRRERLSRLRVVPYERTSGWS